MLCRQKWIECKERIISANARILSQSGRVSDSLAQDDLEKWLKEIEKEPFYSRINLLLNQLAEHFDNKTNEYRRERACKEKIKYLRAKHTFIVIPSKQNVSNLYPVTARMYYRDLPPDDRLIKITIDENLTYSRPLLSAFHEMGHFLGSRYRKERYEQYFRPLILNAFFDQVYQYACIEYSGWNNELGICDFAYSSFLPHEVNCFAQTVANVLNSVMEEISEAFNHACDQALEQIRASVVINGSLEADTIDDRDNVAMDQGFFESLRGLLLMSLQQIIEDSQKFEDVFLNKVLACIDNLPSSITCDDIEVNLKEGFKKAKDKLYEHLEEYKKDSGSKDLLPWYTACEKELEEPIADIFMIKASGISTKKYVDHLLHLYRHLNEQRLKRESELRNKGMTTLLLDEIQKTENASRIIGIALARNESRYCFSRWYDWIAQCIPHRFKPRQYYEARKLLAAMYRAAQTSPTMHQELVYEYIRKVWEDPRYTDIFSKMKRQIKVKGFELQILRFLT